MSMSAKDVTTLVSALVALAIAIMERDARLEQEAVTIEVARTLAKAGLATAEGVECPNDNP